MGMSMQLPNSEGVPFSPILLFGLMLRPVPPIVLRPVLERVMTVVAYRHPTLLERVWEWGNPAFLIEPIDLPLRFVLHFVEPWPRLIPFSEDVPPHPTPDATIRGPLLVLLQALEGRLDGDALFFARDLVIEGDTEAVLALRNALESDAVDLVGDLGAALGPLGGAGRLAFGIASTVFRHAARDLETIRHALVGPLERRITQHASALGALREELAALRRPTGQDRTTPLRRSAAGEPRR